MTGNLKRAAVVTLAASALISGGVAVASNPQLGKITWCVKGSSEYYSRTGNCQKGTRSVTWNAENLENNTSNTLAKR